MDQYYTKQSIIDEVANKVMLLLKKLRKKDIFIVDFSAGDGRLGTKLLDLGFSQDKLLEFDIEPKHERVRQADWLEIGKLPGNVKSFILTFNPPFGKSCHTACRFIDQALQMPDTRVVAAFLILPLYPIVFENASSHKIELLPSNSFSFKDNEVSAPSCLHEVIARPTSFLSFRLYSSLTNKPYYADVSELTNLIAHDTHTLNFSNVKHLLPIALVRKTGFYAGLTAIVIEPMLCTLYCYESIKDESNVVKHKISKHTKPWDVNGPVDKRPWLSQDSRWRLTSFNDDLGEEGKRTGCGSLKILPQEHKGLLDAMALHKAMESFVEYVGLNKDAVRGGGKGPKSIGVGTFYWITNFALVQE